MGHKQISSKTSERKGGSRYNLKEAEKIAFWVRKNFAELVKISGVSSRKEILGIITPFKQQKFLIEKILSREVPEYCADISVGTVHTFQGAERRVIIFSTVYGKSDGCHFVDNNCNLMNVAVSRAKDSFLVFGERECLSNDLRSAGGLLKLMTEQEID